jgi:hypothetical protein
LSPVEHPTPLARTAKPGRTLARLAEGSASGVLTVAGDTGATVGVVHLRDGAVTKAVAYGRGPSPRPPADPDTPGAEIDMLLETADQVFVLCWGRVRECRFTPTEHPDPTGRPGIPVPRLLAEVDRRTAALSAAGSPVDPLTDRIRRIPPPPGRPPLVSGAEYALLVVADGDSTCAELAPALGRGVFGTALDATRLVRIGLLEVVADKGGEVAPLTRRVVGASAIRPRDPAPALWDRSDPEVVDRLLAALDSLRSRPAEP